MKCTYDMIKQMPVGSVVWCESHGVLEGYESDIEYFDVYPMLITKPGENGTLVWCDELSNRIVKITSDNIDNDPDDKYWDRKPKIRKGMISMEEAAAIAKEQEPDNIVYLSSMK